MLIKINQFLSASAVNGLACPKTTRYCQMPHNNRNTTRYIYHHRV